MTRLTLYFGDSATDEPIKQMLEAWSTDKPNITLKCESIHSDPISAVRLGITDLPALVMESELIAQGSPENWIIPLIHRMVSQSDTDS